MALPRDPSPAAAPQYRIIPDEPTSGRSEIQRFVDGGTSGSIYKANVDNGDLDFAHLLAQSAADAEGGTFDPENTEPF